MGDYFIHVNGNNKGKVFLYTLSTCMWCRKTKNLLNELGIEYYYTDVDLLEEAQKVEIRKEVIRWKNRAVYPCLVINDAKCIPEYDEERIRQEFAAT